MVGPDASLPTGPCRPSAVGSFLFLPTTFATFVISLLAPPALLSPPSALLLPPYSLPPTSASLAAAAALLFGRDRRGIEVVVGAGEAPSVVKNESRNAFSQIHKLLGQKV